VSERARHDDWLRDRLLAGWRHGDAFDEQAKTDPRLISFDKLIARLSPQKIEPGGPPCPTCGFKTGVDAAAGDSWTKTAEIPLGATIDDRVATMQVNQAVQARPRDQNTQHSLGWR
jgi:hypothetical protein